MATTNTSGALSSPWAMRRVAAATAGRRAPPGTPLSITTCTGVTSPLPTRSLNNASPRAELVVFGMAVIAPGVSWSPATGAAAAARRIAAPARKGRGRATTRRARRDHTAVAEEPGASCWGSAGSWRGAG